MVSIRLSGVPICGVARSTSSTKMEPGRIPGFIYEVKILDNNQEYKHPEEPPKRDRVREFREMMKTAEKKRRKNRVLNILLVIFAVTFLASGFFLFR